MVWLVASVGAFAVSPTVWPAALLILAGAALVAVPSGGHVGPLVAVGIVLALIGTGASALDADLVAGGAGTRDERPASAAELEDYDLAAGTLRIDLTELADPGAPVDVRARVGVGELVVTVPADAELRATASVGVGEIVVRGRERSGVGVDLDVRLPGAGGPELVLDLSAGIGSIRVRDGAGA